VMYSQSTSGSTQPVERPVTARCGDVSSTLQHSILGHATEEKDRQFIPRDAMLVRYMWAYICSSVYVSLLLSQVGVLSKRMNESSWFWHGSFFPYPTLCYKEILTHVPHK